MEKVKCICVMRDIVLAMSELENTIIDHLGLTLNEAMALCAIGEHSVAASVVADRTGMRASHCSKIVSALERRKLVYRSIDKHDKRQINIALTNDGRERLNRLKEYNIVIPEILTPVFDNYFLK
ncbi:MAG: winged helix-turn-helix transcriptional regulator [Alistipes sp.]|nr:winged helix-turn-helix transcriptional regulator [Alistipes sp.]